MTKNQEIAFLARLDAATQRKEVKLAEVVNGQTIGQCIPAGSKAVAIYASLSQSSIWSVGGITHDTAGDAPNQIFRLDAPPGTYLSPSIGFLKSNVNGAYILYVT